MATWGLHIRIAEKLLDLGFNLDNESFLIGNIGPDCGVANEDWSAFSPPTEISHWKDDCDNSINADLFFETHVKNQNYDMHEKSFLYGYYVHLLTDIEFRRLVKTKKRTDKNYEILNEDKNFIWTIKKDWYDLDHLYFRDNQSSLFYKIFQHVKTFPDYLDYYPKGAVENKVNYITDFYLKSSDNLDRKYIYLTSEEMGNFLDETVKLISDKLDEIIN